MFEYYIHNPTWNETVKRDREYVHECMKLWWYKPKYLKIKTEK